MKKLTTFLFALLLLASFKGFSQAASEPDFFAGKWEITVSGLPDGDAKFATDLVRKDGKLTGELKDPTGVKPAIPIAKVDETKDMISIYFYAEQAGEIAIELTKTENDLLKGQLMNMFDAVAKRVK